MASYTIKYTSASNPYPNEDPAKLEVAEHYSEADTLAVVNAIAAELSKSFQVKIVTTTTVVTSTPWETDAV